MIEKNQNIIEKPINVYNVGYLRLIGLSLLYLLFFFTYGLAFILNNEPVIYDYIIATFLLGLSLYRIIVLILNIDLKIQVFDDRFVYQNKWQTQTFLWSNIENVWTFKYENIDVIFIKYIRVKIQDNSGNVIILDKTLRNIDSLEMIIQEEVTKHKLPIILNAMDQGGEIVFGNFTFTKDKLQYNSKFANKNLNWNDIGKVEIWGYSFRIWQYGKTKLLLAWYTWNIPNLPLFMAVITNMSKKYSNIFVAG